MELYSAAISPYASRVRIQIYYKNLDIDIVPPPGGMRSEQVLAKNPTGKIPVLDLGEEAVAESWAIMEYLEETNPEPAMRPADPLGRAKQVELVRFVDIYLAPAMFPLFLALRGVGGDEEIAKGLEGLQAQLAILEQHLARRSQSDSLDLVDAAVVPIIWYADILARHFGMPNCLDGLPATTAWWQQARAAPAAAKVIEELDSGLRAAIPVLFDSE